MLSEKEVQLKIESWNRSCSVLSSLTCSKRFRTCVAIRKSKITNKKSTAGIGSHMHFVIWFTPRAPLLSLKVKGVKRKPSVFVYQTLLVFSDCLTDHITVTVSADIKPAQRHYLCLKPTD